MKSLLLFLIRHAQTYSNLEGKLQGQKDSALTPEGYRQIEALVKRLRILHSHLPFKAVYSSPISRALITAESISENLKLPLYPEPLLAEMDHGKWDGKTLNDLKLEYREEWNYWKNSPQLAKFPDGESLLQATDRFREFIDKLLREVPEMEDSSRDDLGQCHNNYVVVSHAGIIKLGLILLLGLPLEKYWITGLENASITVLLLQLKEGRLFANLVKLNDTGHLDMELGEPYIGVLRYLKASTRDL